MISRVKRRPCPNDAVVFVSELADYQILEQGIVLPVECRQHNRRAAGRIRIYALKGVERPPGGT